MIQPYDNHTEGDSTVRQCTAVGFPGPLAITWYLNGLPITRHTSSQTTVSSSDVEVKVQSTLTLNNVDKDDLGTLMCLASNSIGSDNETTYFNVICKYSSFIHFKIPKYHKCLKLFLLKTRQSRVRCFL